MMINKKFLSIPPYLSTPWSQVTSLLTDANKNLIVGLKTGPHVGIPGLPEEVLGLIFSTHAQYLQQTSEISTSTDPLLREVTISLPGSLLSPNLLQEGLLPEGLLDVGASFMHHDMNKANSPDLPREFLSKLSLISRKIPSLDTEKLPPAEPHCNCPYCQIARALFQQIDESASSDLSVDEPVSESDLSFDKWSITKTDTNIYHVVNPQNAEEHYTVYLGTPIGCTCGQTGCDHIQAVLRT